MGNVRDNLVKEACEKFNKGEMEKEEYQVYPTERPDWYKARQRGSGFALYGALGIEKEDMDKKLRQHHCQTGLSAISGFLGGASGRLFWRFLKGISRKLSGVIDRFLKVSQDF